MVKRKIKHSYTFIAFVLVGFLLFGFATKTPIWGDEKIGFNLRYRLDNGQKLNYKVSAKSNERLEIGARELVSDNVVNIAYTLVGGQMNDSDTLVSHVTIDDMQMKTIQTALGESGELYRDVSGVIGKSFVLTFSPQGREIDFSGIENITIDMGGLMTGGKQSIRNLLRELRNMLPDLPDYAVKIGETWTSTEEETVSMGTFSMKNISDVTSKIEGHETIDGYKCLRIHTKTNGTTEGSGKPTNIKYTAKGDVAVETTWYFAYKKGLLAKTLSNHEIKLKFIPSGRQYISFPLTIKGEAETKLTTTASRKR